MKLYMFLVGVLAVWRVTHLLQAEDGPGNIVVHLRRLAGHSFLGRLMDCFYCLSLWIAVPFAVLCAETQQEGFLLWLAFSGGAILLERATGNLNTQAQYTEEPNSDKEY